MLNEARLEHGILPELDLLPKTGEPLICISNHTFSANQLPTLGKIHCKRKDLSVVCNAGFSPILTVLGIDTIPVKSLEHKASLNIVRNLWARLIILSGQLSGSTEKSKNGMSLVETIADRVSQGGSVWLTPSGKKESLNSQSPWKRGLEYSIKECLERGLDPDLAMLYISKATQSNILEISKASKLTSMQSQNLGIPLQQHYWRLVSSLT